MPGCLYIYGFYSLLISIYVGNKIFFALLLGRDIEVTLFFITLSHIYIHLLKTERFTEERFMYLNV